MLEEVAKARTDAALIRTTACHARSRWSQTYAGYAIAKGHITQGYTWWLVIEQQFSRSAKTAPRKGMVQKEPASAHLRSQSQGQPETAPAYAAFVSCPA